jgi:hypothetical protein
MKKSLLLAFVFAFFLLGPLSRRQFLSGQLLQPAFAQTTASDSTSKPANDAHQYNDDDYSQFSNSDDSDMITHTAFPPAERAVPPRMPADEDEPSARY